MSASVEVGEAYRVSPQQERTWLLQQREPRRVFRAGGAVRLSGGLDPQTLARAWGLLVERHEILRTRLTRLAGLERPLQVVGAATARWVDGPGAPALSGDDLAARLGSLAAAAEEGEGSILLASGDGGGEWQLLVDLPAYLLDAHGVLNLAAELARTYAEVVAAEEPQREALQYSVVADWFNEVLESEEAQAGRRYWRRIDLSPLPELRLPYERPAAEAGGFTPRCRESRLRGERLAALERLAASQGLPLSTLLLAAWSLLLGRLNGLSEGLVACAVAGRTDDELESNIGSFVRYLPIPYRLESSSPFADFAAALEVAVQEAEEWQECFTWEDLGEAVASLGVAEFFPFAFESLTLPRDQEAAGVTFSLAAVRAVVDRFTLRLTCVRSREGLGLQLWYDAGRASEDEIELIAARLETLLAALPAHPDAACGELEILPAAERSRVLAGYNDTARELSQDRCLHELFDAQAARTPEAVAVVAGGAHLSYRHLGRSAAALAGRLAALGVAPDRPVAICAERSPEMLVAVLAVLGAGGFYVPLDPDYPPERLALMIEDSGAEVLLIQEHLGDRLRVGADPRRGPPGVAAGPTRVLLDAEALLTAAGPEARPPLPADPDNLVYVIYTSGSTGRPKGVMVRHRGVVNRILWAQGAYPVTAEDRVLQKASFSFDFSVWECFGPLLAGGRLVLARPGGQRDGAYLVRAVCEHRISLLHFVPSMLQVFAEQESLEDCSSLRFLFSGGEALSWDLAGRCRDRLPSVPLRNQYGPTEISIDVTEWICRPGRGSRPAPIGTPVANNRVYVTDRRLGPVPGGTPGELALGGVGVARGYLGRPALTAERFVPDPFGGEPGARLYRTGDLGRHLQGGDLEFVGRTDHQIKIRGYRIEPGEVESVLAAQPGVRECAVVARDDGGGLGLVAYVVRQALPGESAEPADAAELRGALGAALPAYMVPAAFVFLERLPLTPSGKLDRRSLPAPEQRRGGVRTPFTAPRNPLEVTLVGLWEELLDRREVGVEDSFFELGGHSLLATRLVSRVRQLLEVELPLRVLFDSETVAGVAAWIAGGAGGAGERAPALRPVPRDRPLPLSFAQQRLWFLDQLEPGQAVYNIPAAVLLEGALAVDALHRSFREIVRRHEALRTTFATVEEEVVQVIARRLALDLPLVDLSALAAAEGSAVAVRLAAAEHLRPFALDRGPLLRVALLRLAERRHVCLLTMHHIVSDGWSAGILLRELAAFYELFRYGRPSPLPELPVQYADFAVWQRQWLSGEVLAGQTEYWRQRLDGAPQALSLATDRPRPAVPSYAGGRQPLVLDEALTAAVKELAGHTGATPFMVLLGAFAALLGRYSAQTDLVVGTPVANRGRHEVEGLIGFFANTLALRLDLAADPGFAVFVKQAREVLVAALTHQDVPFEMLVAELVPGRDLSRSPLFQVMFGFTDLPRERVSLEGLEMAPVAGKGGTAKFDLELVLWEEASGGVSGYLEYGSDLFDPTTAARLCRHYLRLLSAAVADPSHRLSTLPLAAAAERQQVVVEWNDTATPLPGGESFPALFRAQAARLPESTAVVAGDRHLTYARLAELSARVARTLAADAPAAGRVVALLLPRGLELLAAMLGIFEAGAVYLPLEPEQPIRRLVQMTEAAAADLIVAAEELLPRAEEVLAGRARPAPGRAVAWGSLLADGRGPATGGGALAAGSQPAYVIFTSGSTGVPKGAVVDHRGMLNHLLAKVADLELTGADRVAQTASQSFDISVWQLLAALLTGGRVDIAEDRLVVDPLRLLDEVEARGVTILELVPSVLRAALEGWSEGGRPPGLRRLRWLLMTGEALAADLCDRWAKLYPGIPLLNAYGPTECSDDVTHHPLAPPLPPQLRVPIGRPIANSRLYVVDHRAHPCPAGVPGELVVGGLVVGQGYIGAPGRTAAAFVPDPFAEGTGSRLYRTGDLVRCRRDGAIEFLGRIDHQVKIRGFRIELGEVETALAACPEVRQAVVVARRDQGPEPRLVAYLVFEPERTLAPKALLGRLRGRLPEHMLPSAVVALAAIPLTRTGKVDRQALPVPALQDLLTERELRPASSLVAEIVAEVFAEVLEVEAVGGHEDFFERGGHSLLATKVMARLRPLFGVEDLPLRSLFEAPTPTAMAAVVEAALQGRRGEERLPIRRVPRHEAMPLSHAQQRVWFAEQVHPGNASYNIPRAVRLTGVLDPRAFAGAFTEVCQRHETLRTTFHEGAAGPVQRIGSPRPFQLPVVDLSGAAEGDREEALHSRVTREAHRPFDLARGPLLRAILFRLGPQEHALSLTMHHIISDLWSMTLLIAEVSTLYESRLTSEPAVLPELAVQYVDFASWQRQRLAGGLREQLVGYWQRRLAGGPEAPRLPFDSPPPPELSFRGGFREWTLPEDLADALRRLSRQRRATLFVTMLAAFKLLLHGYSGQQDIVVGAPISGRTERELEGVVGFFLNTLALRTDLGGDPSFGELVARVRETVLGAIAHQDLPFDEVVRQVATERDSPSSSLTRVWFNFQNTPLAHPSLRGLRIEALPYDFGLTKFDLAVNVTPGSGGIRCVLEFAADRFRPATIARMGRRYERLLSWAAAEPHASLSLLCRRLDEAEDLEQAAQREGSVALIQSQLGALRRRRSAGIHGKDSMP
jgi:amino acid adenylation domain-containing protein